MELSEADIARLERRGHRRQDFCYNGVDSIPRLRNEGVGCYFYDVEKKRCREYQARPLGCALYPVNIDQDDEVFVDDLCPQGRSITAQELELKGKRLRALIRTIDEEARKRSS